MVRACGIVWLFFFNDTATTEIYTLSLHDALPIFCSMRSPRPTCTATSTGPCGCAPCSSWRRSRRSEEHTSELQSLAYLVCRLLLEKKKNTIFTISSQKKKNTKIEI